MAQAHRFDQFQIVTALTVLLVIAWVLTRIIQVAWVQDLATPILDGLISSMIIGWFGSAALKMNGKKNGGAV